MTSKLVRDPIGYLLLAMTIGATVVQLHAADISKPEFDPEAKKIQLHAGYTLGPDDVITVRGMHAYEIVDKPIRVEANGNVTLPLIGPLRAGGLTIEQFQSDLNDRLKNFYVEPQVSVTVTEFRSQPISILGAVANPGTHQLQGRKTVLEMLSMVGGVRNDAGPVLKITRQMQWGPIPLPGATVDESGEFSVAELNLSDLFEAKRPVNNILVRPLDVISIPSSAVIYVIGEVKKSGGFALGSRSSLSVLEALSMAEGFQAKASPKNARILRLKTSSDRQRTEIPVNMSRILAGKAADVPLERDDILFIPNSAARSAALRSVEAAVQIGTGLVIWRR
jgi:polysaccharide export outer membrane protein